MGRAVLRHRGAKVTFRVSAPAMLLPPSPLCLAPQVCKITLPWSLRLGTDCVLQAGNLGEGDVSRDVTSDRHLAHLIQEQTSSSHTSLRTSTPHLLSLPSLPFWSSGSILCVRLRSRRD